MLTFWKYTLVETDDYNQMVARENATAEKIKELNEKVELQRTTIMDLEGEKKQASVLEMRLADTAMAAGASEAALEKTLREEFAETLTERDAELARSVQQATSLGYDNELLQKQIAAQENEIAALKRSEEEKWIAANQAQAEVIRLKAELEMAKPAPKPPAKRGKRNG